METTLLPTQAPNQANIYEDSFKRQKAYFATNITRSYEWRVDQLGRLARLLSEHTNEFYEALSRDFKTALSGKVFSSRGCNRPRRLYPSFSQSRDTKRSSIVSPTALRSSWDRSMGHCFACCVPRSLHSRLETHAF